VDHTSTSVRGAVFDLAQRAAGVHEANLGHALRAAVDLRDAVDSFLGELVAMARDEGATWAEIGAALGVTTQAAHQRYGPRTQAARSRS
jgi:hypothetical protein